VQPACFNYYVRIYQTVALIILYWIANSSLTMKLIQKEAQNKPLTKKGCYRKLPAE